MPDPVLGPVAMDDVFKVTIKQTLYGQRIMNVLWYVVTGEPGAPPDRWAVQQGLADAIGDPGGMVTAMAAAQVHVLTYDSVKVNSYRGLSDRQPYSEVLFGTTGEIVEESGDANTTASIEKRAIGFPTAPRTGIGRMQLAGMPLGGYAAGLFDDAQMLLLAGVADELLNNITVLGTQLTPCIVTWGPLALSAHPLFGAIPKRTVRTQRTRTVGVGE